MAKTAKGRLLLFTILASLGVTASQSATLSPPRPVAHPHAELSAEANLVVQRGIHAELPPHISTLLGLSHEEKCDVVQGVVRSGEKVQGFEVAEKNHNDIVIFIVDPAAQDQTFYLTSPSGALRKVLSVKQGVGRVVKPTRADLEAFQNEKKCGRIVWPRALRRTEN